MPTDSESDKLLDHHPIPQRTGLRSIPPNPPRTNPEWKLMLRAFKHRNYRLYFVGLLISVVGMWAQNIAQSWLILDLTNSPLVLGQVMAVMAIPVWIFSPFAGVIVDRFPRRTILFITQSIQMVQAFVLAYLTFSGKIEVWHVFWLSGLRGFANAFDAPTRHAFIVELVGKEDLSNGIAMNSTLFGLARLLGPSVGAIILATFGTAWAFTVNGITFLSILISLLLIRVEKQKVQEKGQSPLKDLLEGVRFIRDSRAILALMIIVLTVALFGSNFNTLLPVIVRNVLHSDEITYGLMGTALGIGSLVGTLLVTRLSSMPKRGKRLNQLNLIFPALLVGFAFSRSLYLSLGMLVLIGVSFIPQLAMSNILIQSNVPDRLRGRVMSVYTLLIFGAFPIGAWISGGIAEKIGAPTAILISAGAVATVSMLVRVTIPELAELD